MSTGIYPAYGNSQRPLYFRLSQESWELGRDGIWVHRINGEIVDDDTPPADSITIHRCYLRRAVDALRVAGNWEAAAEIEHFLSDTSEGDLT